MLSRFFISIWARPPVPMQPIRMVSFTGYPSAPAVYPAASVFRKLRLVSMFLLRRYLLPLARLSRLKHCVSNLVGRQAVAKTGPRRLIVTQSRQKIRHLVNERV